MKVLDNYSCEGQMSIFDFLDPDTWSGKTYQEPSVPTKAKTSDVCLKKFAELRIKPPMYLDLRTENGVRQVASWETVGPLLGEYMMHSFGECPSVENESRLSQILEDRPHQKYSLSAKACQGILNRANRRGKKLPEVLEKALIRQATPLKSEGGVEVDSKGKKAGKGALVQTELSGTLGVSQDQTLITTGKCLNSWDVQSKHIQPESGVAEALYSGECRGGGGESYVLQSAGFKGGQSSGGIGYQEECSPTLQADTSALEPTVYCLQGNGIDRADTAGCNGKGWRENQSYTLNTIDRPAVLATSIDEKMGNTYVHEEKGNTLSARDYKQPQAVCYQEKTGTLNPGAHAGSYNGQDAYNDMLIVGVNRNEE